MQSKFIVLGVALAMLAAGATTFALKLPKPAAANHATLEPVYPAIPPRAPATIPGRDAATLSGGLGRGLNRPGIRDAVVTARQYEPEPRKL